MSFVYLHKRSYVGYLLRKKIVFIKFTKSKDENKINLFKDKVCMSVLYKLECFFKKKEDGLYLKMFKSLFTFNQNVVNCSLRPWNHAIRTGYTKEVY